MSLDTPVHVTCDHMTGTACLVSPQALNQGEIKTRSRACGAVRRLLLSYQRIRVWFCSHVSPTNAERSRTAAQPLIRSASTAGRASCQPNEKSAKRRAARRPRQRCTAHCRGRSDWPTTGSCHLSHGANECASERASERRMVRAMWSRWRPCVLAAPAARGARVRDSGRASRRHARPKAPSCTGTASHASPPTLLVAAPAGG